MKKLILAALFAGLTGSAFAQPVHRPHGDYYRDHQRIVKPIPRPHYDREYFKREHQKVDRMLRYGKISRQEAFRMHKSLDRRERDSRPPRHR